MVVHDVSSDETRIDRARIVPGADVGVGEAVGVLVGPPGVFVGPPGVGVGPHSLMQGLTF